MKANCYFKKWSFYSSKKKILITIVNKCFEGILQSAYNYLTLCLEVWEIFLSLSRMKWSNLNFGNVIEIIHGIHDQNKGLLFHCSHGWMLLPCTNYYAFTEILCLSTIQKSMHTLRELASVVCCLVNYLINQKERNKNICPGGKLGNI